MKKLLCCLLCLSILTGCYKAFSEKESKPVFEGGFSRGVWLSYTEINIFIKNGFKEEFSKCLENMKSLKITDLYFHVVANFDSVIKSKIYPQTDNSKKLDFDILEYVISKCHSENIRIHAWINPYRVSAVATDISALDPESLAKIPDKSDIVIYNGIYLNPASQKARKTVLDGIKELCESYQIDGIHFDDYFYPTTDKEFDSTSYESYKNGVKTAMSLEDFRRTNVDMLISDCKTYLDSEKEKIIFSISPTASLEKNYNTLYADVEGWVKNGYIDWLVPQLYFGFNHTQAEYGFENLLKSWEEVCGEGSVKLIIGLAPYKIGNTAFGDGVEWKENSDIISRQTKICLENENVSGVAFFSYSGLFSKLPQNITERQNLIKVFEVFEK